MDRQRPQAASQRSAAALGPTVYVFCPVGLDAWEHRPHQPAPGTRVVKTQPPGCPPNGTMGHCYVAHAATGAFYGLVLLNSLRPA
jgi:hypothetical protein